VQAHRKHGALCSSGNIYNKHSLPGKEYAVNVSGMSYSRSEEALHAGGQK
jgi:hypothetical protein